MFAIFIIVLSIVEPLNTVLVSTVQANYKYLAKMRNMCGVGEGLLIHIYGSVSRTKARKIGWLGSQSQRCTLKLICASLMERWIRSDPAKPGGMTLSRVL